MRHIGLAVIVGMAAMLGFSGTAKAAATVDLVWSGTTGTAAAGGTAINAVAGDTLTLDVLLTAGSEGLSSWGISIQFDADLLDELDLVPPPSEFGIAPTLTCTPFPTCFFGTPTISPLSPGTIAGTVESTTTGAGFLFTFEAATLGTGVTDSFGQFQIGQITFDVTGNVATDGIDVQSGFFNVITDGAFDNVGSPVPMNFNGAAANVSGPEPGAALLLGLGLFGLAVAGQRSRR